MATLVKFHGFMEAKDASVFYGLLGEHELAFHHHTYWVKNLSEDNRLALILTFGQKVSIEDVRPPICR